MAEGDLDNTIRQENYRTEYRVVATNHRFYTSLRFIMALFTATLQSALFTLYNQASQQGTFQLRATIILFVGIITMFAVMVIERRNIALFRIMIQRGRELESFLGLNNGQFNRLSAAELVRPKGLVRFVTHTWGVRILYSVIISLWAVLFILGFVR